jgi:histidinol-phosphatase
MENMNSIPQIEIKALHEFLLQIADATKVLILELWHAGAFAESLKEDKTPVTQVDLQAEKLAREMIQRKFPAHGIIGEEYPSVNPDSDFQWTIDPIDGTQNLVNRIPTFGTLLGLRFRGQAVLGVIEHPVLGLRTSGGQGIGVFHNQRRLHPLVDIGHNQLSPYDLLATNSAAVFGDNAEAAALLTRVLSFHPQQRIYYDCYAHTLALLGSVAVVVEPNLRIWDITPLEALIAEIGGSCLRFGESTGAPAKVLVNAVFGKPKAVNAIALHLGIAS